MPHDRIRAEDGTFLEVKEGIVLDQHGNPVAKPSAQDSPFGGGTSVRMWRGGLPMAILLGIAIPVVLVAGFAVFGVLLAILLLAFVIRSVLRALGMR